MPHEALSYTWGGTGKQLHIVVNSKGLQVTNNLYEAFLHLRHTDRERSLTQGVPACHLSVRSFRAELAPPVLSSFPLKVVLATTEPDSNWRDLGKIHGPGVILLNLRQADADCERRGADAEQHYHTTQSQKHCKTLPPSSQNFNRTGQVVTNVWFDDMDRGGHQQDS